MTRVPTGISKFEDEFLLAVHIFMLDLGLVTSAYHVAVLAHVKMTREVFIYVRWQIIAARVHARVCACVWFFFYQDKPSTDWRTEIMNRN